MQSQRMMRASLWLAIGLASTALAGRGAVIGGLRQSESMWVGPGASQSTVSGDWVATWDAGLRTRDAQVLEVTNRSQAALHLEQTGDSVRGTWTNPGRDRPGWEVRGTFREGLLALESDVGNVESNGQTVYVRVRWRGRLRDGVLSGSMYIRLSGPECTVNGRLCDREPPLRRWEAVRRPG